MNHVSPGEYTKFPFNKPKKGKSKFYIQSSMMISMQVACKSCNVNIYDYIDI